MTASEGNQSIDELSRSLKEAWEQDQRVKALKIVIQCSKLLDDFADAPSYPARFQQITNLLEDFGRLVFLRISTKSKGIEQDIAHETCKNWFYKVASIRELIPRFYVECSILQIYQFISDQTSHDNLFEESLVRLSKMIRGIGNPLIALNARAYLCRVAKRLIPLRQAVIVQNFTDFFVNCEQITPEGAKAALGDQSVPYSTYLTLFSPPLNSICEYLAETASDLMLADYMEEITKKEKELNRNLSLYALILNSVFAHFHPNFIVSRAAGLLETVKSIVADAKSCAFPVSTLLQSLGNCFVMSDYSSWQRYDDQFRLTVLNDIWKIIGRLPPEEYIACAEVWVDFVTRQFGPTEITIVLKDIVRRALKHTAIEKSYDKLLSIIKKVTMARNIDLTAVITMDGLMAFLDLLQKEDVKVEACKLVLQAFLERRRNMAHDSHEPAPLSSPADPLSYSNSTNHIAQSTFIDPLAANLINTSMSFADPLSGTKSFSSKAKLKTAAKEEPTTKAPLNGKADPLGAEAVNKFYQSVEEEDLTISDPVILNAVNNLCKTMHDAINALTLEDDRRQISKLIVDYLSLVVYDDLEAHLNFLVEARANYFNLDSVTSFLIFQVNQLAMQAKEKARNSKKHSSFVKACASYAFITIPSLDDYAARLQLYLLSAQVALTTNCLSQADGLLRAAIVLLSQLPSTIDLSDNKSCSAEPFFVAYVSSMLSFLIIVPDNPDQDPIYLTRGLFNATKERTFEDPDRRVKLYFNFISYANIASQSKYPYGLDNVESNDIFYGQSEQFLSVLRQLSNEALEEIIVYLNTLGEQQKLKRQANLALESFCHIVCCADTRSMSKIALKFWSIARKSNAIDRKQLDKVYRFLASKSDTRLKDNSYADLLAKIKSSLN